MSQPNTPSAVADIATTLALIQQDIRYIREDMKAQHNERISDREEHKRAMHLLEARISAVETLTTKLAERLAIGNAILAILTLIVGAVAAAIGAAFR